MNPTQPLRSTSWLVAALALAAPVCLTQCTGIPTSGSTRSPATSLPKHEYPFDSQGNYREDWVAGGGGSGDSKPEPARTSKPLFASLGSGGNDKPDPTPPARLRTSTRNPGSSSGTREVVASMSTPTPEPAPAPSPAPAPAPAPTPKPSPPAASSGSSSPASTSSSSPSKSYTVQGGDTLWGISRKYSTSVASIKSANGLSSDLIKPGQTLKIP